MSVNTHGGDGHEKAGHSGSGSGGLIFAMGIGVTSLLTGVSESFTGAADGMMRGWMGGGSSAGHDSHGH